MPRRDLIRKMRKAANRMDTRAGKRQMREVLRYASGSNSFIARSLKRAFGNTLGGLIAMLADIFAGGSRVNESDIQDAIKLLEASGYRVRRATEPPTIPPPIAPPTAPANRQGATPPPLPTRPGVQPPPLPSRGTSPGAQPPPLPTRQPEPQPTPPSPAPEYKPLPDLRQIIPAIDEWPDEHTIDTRKLSAVMARGAGIWENEIETPESSNVHSFAYDVDEGILYVTYKADGKAGPDGKRPHVRGAMYSYGGRARPVPQAVYDEMRTANSKGKFVWDRLRVRGTIWGHNYPYTLVSPSMAGGNIYVPRKATRRGFRVRSIAAVAPIGRKGNRRSTLMRSNLPERRF